MTKGLSGFLHVAVVAMAVWIAKSEGRPWWWFLPAMFAVWVGVILFGAIQDQKRP